MTTNTMAVSNNIANIIRSTGNVITIIPRSRYGYLFTLTVTGEVHSLDAPVSLYADNDIVYAPGGSFYL